MQVTVLAHTAHPNVLIKAAFATCYSVRTPQELYELALEEESNAPSRINDFIGDKLATGHDSPLEHASISFAISGVSRSLTHQLVRHRIASYSQQSQRYVVERNLNGAPSYVIPPSINAIPQAAERFKQAMAICSQAYEDLVNEYKIPAEDARFLFTNAKTSNIVVTMNYRSLLRFFSLRCCRRAQWEIRAMAMAMLREAKKQNKLVFGGAGAACVMRGYCPESPRFSCGLKPTLIELIGAGTSTGSD